MNKKDILKKVDHTILKQITTFRDVQVLCDDAIANNCASVCIPPCFVKRATEYVEDKIPVCTVIGFPNGYNTTETKVFETKNALKNGATEIDVVINIGMVKSGDYDNLTDELSEINRVIRQFEQKENKKIVYKVIIETCLLTKNEIKLMCYIVHASGADYIKTSTGFSTEGATPEVMAIIKENVDIINTDKTENLFKIKASGGIKNFEDAEMYIEKYGADRLGTSRLIPKTE